jgi:hypothetical protein
VIRSPIPPVRPMLRNPEWQVSVWLGVQNGRHSPRTVQPVREKPVRDPDARLRSKPCRRDLRPSVFQAGHIRSWRRIVRASCAVAGCCWWPLVAAVAATVAVSRVRRADGRWFARQVEVQSGKPHGEAVAGVEAPGAVVGGICRYRGPLRVLSAAQVRNAVMSCSPTPRLRWVGYT